MEVVLIVDDDLGFVFWLGQALDAAGYSAFPARSAAAAASLIAELNLKPGVLVINPDLTGALDFAARLRQAYPALKAIGIARDLEAQHTPPLDFVYPRPRAINAAAKTEWLEAIARVRSSSTEPPREEASAAAAMMAYRGA